MGLALNRVHRRQLNVDGVATLLGSIGVDSFTWYFVSTAAASPASDRAR
jgi:hypothetical protein